MKTSITPRPFTSPLSRLVLAATCALAAGTHAALADDDTVRLPAFTATADTGDQNPYMSPDAISASRIRAAISDTAGSISVLTPQFLTNIEPTRIYEATAYLAGITEGRSGLFSDRQIIRGFENTGRTVDNFVSVQNQNTDPLFMERIEVVKGPNAILAPTGTPGGSINVVSKVPQYQTGDVVTAEVGLNDAQRFDIDLTGPFAPGSPFAYRILVAGQDGYLSREGGWDKRAVAGLELSYHINSRTTLLVRTTYESNRLYATFPVYVDSSDVDGGNATLGAGFQWNGSRNGEESWAHRGGLYETADMMLTSSFGDHVSFRLAAKAQYNIQNDQFLVGIVPSLSNRYNPYTGVETPNQTWALSGGTYVPTTSAYYNPSALVRQPNFPHDWIEDYAAQGDLAARYGFGPVSSTTIMGFAFEHEDDYATTYLGASLPAFNLYAPVYGAVPAWTSISLWQTFSDQTLEEYADETLGFFNDRLSVTGGVVRVAAYDGSTNLLVAKSYALLNDSKDLAMFSVLAKPIDHVSVYFSKSLDAIPTIANAAPLWQEGEQYEYGVKLDAFNKRLAFTAAHFQISQTNNTVPNPAFTNAASTIGIPQTLISDLKDHGYEFELTGGLTRHLSVVASATYLHLRDSLNRPERAISGQNLALFLDYDFTDSWERGLSVFGGATYVGRRSGEVPTPNFTPLGVPTQPSFFLPPLTLVSLGCKYQWSPRLSTMLNIDNVTDQHYFEGPTSRANMTIGDPLNVRLTTTYRFR